jgi:hypothetical protein
MVEHGVEHLGVKNVEIARDAELLLEANLSLDAPRRDARRERVLRLTMQLNTSALVPPPELP